MSYFIPNRNHTIPIEEPSDAPGLSTASPPASTRPPFSPSYADLQVSRAILQAKLPTELVLQMLDYAEYWPSRVFKMQRICDVRSYSSAPHGKICLDIDVVPQAIEQEFRGENVKVKAVEFTITSRDQGWTTGNCKGTYNTTSWMEVSILRRENPDAESLPDQTAAYQHENLNSKYLYESLKDFESNGFGWTVVERPAAAEHYPQDDGDTRAWYLQGNLVAAGAMLTHRVWCNIHKDSFQGNEGAGGGQGFLDELRPGDRMVVLARAKWIGWVCLIQNLEVMIKYGV